MRLRVHSEPQQGASYDTLRAAARAAEDMGFDGFFCSDHLVRLEYADGLSGAVDYAPELAEKRGAGEGLPGPSDVWLTLAALARETATIRLGTLVSPVTFRHPGLLAVQVAQVDAMSGGRVELGLGAGWFEREHRAYGIPFPDNRFALLEEQLAVITGLWRTPPGQSFDFAGEQYRLERSPALPKPVQQPNPPIILGGNGPRRLPRLAAAYADEYNVDFRTADEAVAAFDRVRAACEVAGRDSGTLTLSYSQVVCCGRDEAELAERADAIGRGVAELRANALCGTPAELADRLNELAATGADRVYLGVLDLSDLDHLELIASEVQPRLEP